MGAWIETTMPDTEVAEIKSPPSWGRGLKPFSAPVVEGPIQSPPSWGRGLKLHRVNLPSQLPHVAPFMGAWIET